MKKLAVFAVAAVMAVSSFGAATWIGDSYLYANGDWYTASGAAGDWTSGAWSDLGTISSLLLGGQVQAYDAGGVWGEASGQWMHYSIDYDPENPTAATWVDLDLGSAGAAPGNPNNTLLQNGGSTFAPVTVDLSTYMDDGQQHSISVYFGAVDGNYDSNGGANYTATFKAETSAVPEPATMSLLGLGALAMVLRRKLRK